MQGGAPATHDTACAVMAVPVPGKEQAGHRGYVIHQLRYLVFDGDRIRKRLIAQRKAENAILPMKAAMRNDSAI